MFSTPSLIRVGKYLWIANIQFFVIQLIVAFSWSSPTYSVRKNMISDLGNSIISPSYQLMNFSFIMLGLLSIIGALLLRSYLYTRVSGFRCMIFFAAGAVGVILVGLDPENIDMPAHVAGAFIASLNVLAILISSWGFKPNLKFINLKSISLYGALFLILAAIYFSFMQGIANPIEPTVDNPYWILSPKANFLGLGMGGFEKLLCYPLALWQISVAAQLRPSRNN